VCIRLDASIVGALLQDTAFKEFIEQEKHVFKYLRQCGKY